MVTKAASNFRDVAVSFKDTAISTAQNVHKNVCEFRISTRTLGTILHVLNTAAGVVALSYNPQAALLGGVAGGAARRVFSGKPEPISDEDLRTNRTAQLCFTGIATLYTLAASPANSDSALDASNVVPFLLGFEGIADGVYLLLRKAIG